MYTRLEKMGTHHAGNGDAPAPAASYGAAPTGAACSCRACYGRAQCAGSLLGCVCVAVSSDVKQACMAPTDALPEVHRNACIAKAICTAHTVACPPSSAWCVHMQHPPHVVRIVYLFLAPASIFQVLFDADQHTYIHSSHAQAPPRVAFQAATSTLLLLPAAASHP